MPGYLTGSVYWPTSGVCELRTSYARVAMIPWSAPGSQWSRTALTVATITGTAAPSPAASVIRWDPILATRGEAPAEGCPVALTTP